AAGAALIARAKDVLAQGPATPPGAPPAGAGSSAATAPAAAAARAPLPRPTFPVIAPGGQVAVHTPNGTTLPWTLRDGVKVGHLVAEAVLHEVAPGLSANCWGDNGRVHGPTIDAIEGDRLRIYVTNRLPEPTTVHWHGVILPNGMD